MKFYSLYQYILNQNQDNYDEGEWKEFQNYCMNVIKINFNKRGRADLALNNYIVEEVFSHLLITIYKKINSYNKEISTFKTWVSGYIKQIVRNFSDRKYPVVAKVMNFSEIANDDEKSNKTTNILLDNKEETDPEKVIQYKEVLYDVRASLEELNLKYYKILKYKAYGYSSDEISEIMKIPKDKVYKLVNKARKQLKDKLIKKGWDLEL